jgi:putative hydrolase of the HAD superfamily
MAERRVEAVLLDIDDTLVDTRASFRAALHHVVARWMPHLDAARREDAVLHWALDPRGHYRAYTRGETTFSGQRRLRGTDLHATFGGPVLDDEAFARWEDGYEAAFRAAWAARPGAVALLDALDAAGLPYGALTNMESGYQRTKLDAVGLGRLAVLGSMDDLGRGKPDPELFRLACRRLGSDPARTAYLGDEVDVDARGARDAGLLGIWFDAHGTGADPGDVPVARSLDEVLPLLGVEPPPAPADGAPGSRFGAGLPGR